ncbi:hypothetical protein D9615_007573 [Tricholomella constricta]|uniref:Transcription factor TFIIIC triple barrel domain-containing protein n=1 Tax=Tricholomella constricta TaxID=117010 RepID=A0A8H5M2F5_9AGAR|nr:hypothetical protein D9615_007573 [Tricholomella constricta]
MNLNAASLCPGYKHVDAFGPPDDYEDEGEVTYVTLDLGSIEPTLVPSSSTYRLIGLDTPTPFLQLSGTILKGRHETLLGTELIFADVKDPPPQNAPHKKAGTHAHTLAHLAGTSQRVCFREVRLRPKDTSALASTSSSAPHARAGKGKEADEVPGDLEMEVEAAALMVDRVTGKNAPRPRAARTKAGAAESTRQTRGRKAKGKGKAEQQAQEMDVDQE